MDSIDWIIINKSLDGSLDDQESKMLSDWLAESAEHRALYQKIKAYDSYSLSCHPHSRIIGFLGQGFP